jgi:integrase/recombinase XerD
MTPLRQRMIEEMQRRNLSPRTIVIYTTMVARFAAHFKRSPDRLGPEEVRAYQLHLIREKHVSWPLFNQSVSALKFLYGAVLGRPDVVKSIPYGKRPRRLPAVLSQDEVLRLLAAVGHRVHRLALTAVYSAGLRVGEVVSLRVEDVDSARMVLHIRQSKGQKDRLVPLAAALLDELRTYWRAYRPRMWLFPGAATAASAATCSRRPSAAPPPPPACRSA